MRNRREGREGRSRENRETCKSSSVEEHIASEVMCVHHAENCDEERKEVDEDHEIDVEEEHYSEETEGERVAEVGCSEVQLVDCEDRESVDEEFVYTQVPYNEIDAHRSESSVSQSVKRLRI